MKKIIILSSFVTFDLILGSAPAIIEGSIVIDASELWRSALLDVLTKQIADMITPILR